MTAQADALLPASIPPARRRRVGPRLIVFALLAASLAGLAVFWRSVGHEWVFPKKWGEIEPGWVFRSGQISRFNLESTFDRHRIDVVVFMSGYNPNNPDVRFEKELCERKGIALHNFPLHGRGTGRVESYIDALETAWRARQAGRRVLIHCDAGSQRTGGMTVLWRVLIEGRPAPDAYRELLAYGHDPQDNPDLIPYLNRHMAQIAAELHRRGVIAAVPDPLPTLGP